ncbi:MAG TPA: LPS export ABC transporter permease LptG [Thermoanaerobaculia bacterium]|jgi:LPS export ABC transporter permease LptG|nr:LPS export ABC transporter permease LptG [Thermoanaerobaculia bacterium]
MGILTRYVFKEMVGPTALGFAFYTSLILMRLLFDLAGFIIRRSVSGSAVGKLLLYSLPNVVVLTLPMALLFGILIAIGRLSSDSEIVAMRALGISLRKIYRPVFVFSFLMFLLTLYIINFVMPRGNQQFSALRNELTAASAERVVKPRVFYDDYENLMIYVNDVDPATGQWKGVFVADNRGENPEQTSMTPAEMSAKLNAPPDDEEAVGGLTQQGAGQRTIIANRGSIALQRPENELWMNLFDAETHVWDPSKPDRYDRTESATQRILLPSRDPSAGISNPLARSFREMDLRQLIYQERTLSRSQYENDRMTRNIALVEIHKKLAIPFACITFGVLGLPLGITNRRGGKSSGFSLSIAIIVFYYILINNGEQLAGSGKIPPFLGMWGANIILLAFGIYLLSRANRDALARRSEGGILTRIASGMRRIFTRPSAGRMVTEENPSLLNRLDVTFPNILDRYILREFAKVLVLVLVSVVALFIIVEYTEIARDMRENKVAASTVLGYFRFQLFTVLHWTLPISVLVATLVTFGILSKNNEVTAIKSNGVSLYRIAAPIVFVAAMITVLAYFILDFVLPYANQRASQFKRRIEGKTVVTSTQQKLWYLGKGRYIINFLAYDANAKRLTQVQVFEFHPSDFRLTRRVYATSATWNGQAWAFENGWMRSFADDGESTFTPITRPLALFYPETPEDFATEVTPPDQMTYAQLRRYIGTLRESGYAADELSVKLYAKTSWPAISIVMALIAMPFAFRMGRRGALYGIGLALVLGIIYWLVYGLFTKFGEVGNLPPLLSAWSANILFALAAVYMFLHVET